MGTRALTVMCEENFGEEIAVLYRQFDGYPEGHGLELADFLRSLTPTNGIPMGANKKVIVNGSGCLAARLVAYFKTEAGGFYLRPPNTRDVGEEYVYVVSIVRNPESDQTSLTERIGPSEASIHLRVEESSGAVLYDGPVKDYDGYLDE